MYGSSILITMRLLFAILILTLVARTMANPHLDAPTKVSEGESSGSNVSPETIENLSIDQSKQKLTHGKDTSITFNKGDYFYPYRSEFGVHAGVVFGIEDSSDDPDLMNLLLGFTYILPKSESPKWVLGIDLSMVGHGHFIISKRHIYNEKSSFRPFYQYGILHRLDPDDRFSSFSDFEHYLARAGVGLSDIVKPPRSVEIELNLAVGAKDVLVMFTYGYSWGS